MPLSVGENNTDVQGGAVGPGIGEKVVELPGFDQRALVHEDDPVGHLPGKAHFVGHHARGHAFTDSKASVS